MKNASALRERWALLAPREKALVAGATGFVALALLWWLAISPALAVLRGAEAQHRTLDAQLQRMLAMQAQAQQLQAQPRQGYDEAVRLLETTVKQKLGLSARITIAGDRVTLALAGTPPDALAQWLTQARVNARALPSEARLIRNAAGTWDGTVVLTLPPR
ncbi:MAG: type II secretion system protein M [Burkholderiales bacterium]|nr:type II secretion system protein M [Burkholderiales bacterium]